MPIESLESKYIVHICSKTPQLYVYVRTYTHSNCAATGTSTAYL